MVWPLIVTKGFFVLTLILFLLSPASASVVSAENKLTGYFYGENENLIEGLLIEAIKIPSLILSQESSLPLTETRVEMNRQIEIISPFFFLAAGILAGINPCLLAVMAFLASVIVVQQGGRKEMLKITLGFSTGILTIHILAGIGILSAVNFLPAVRESFTEITILLTALLGFWHVFDAYWLKKHARSTFRTPDSLKKFMSGMNQEKPSATVLPLRRFVFSCQSPMRRGCLSLYPEYTRNENLYDKRNRIHGDLHFWPLTSYCSSGTFTFLWTEPKRGH